MAHNILFLVTGKTPQIITETIWALACDPNNEEQWVPDEVHVLSTEDGLDQIRSRLFNDGVFKQFKEDYPILKEVEFAMSNKYLHGIKDKNNVKLSDLKTPDDNEDAANSICNMIRQFSQRNDVNLHVSIAGGRKTMGFYAGYALSLYGRSQDSMSHVLVEERFESARDFFYPTLLDSYVTNRQGDEVNAKNATVWLAKIPFVKMRSQLNDDEIMSNLSFSETVEFVNQSYELPQIIIMDNDDCLIIFQNKKVKLSPKEFALYLLAVQLNYENKTLRYPNKNIATDTIGEESQKRFNEIYKKFRTGKSQKEVIMNYDNFGPTVSRIKRKLTKNFGRVVAEKICISKLKDGKYGIPLPSSHIRIEKY